MHLLYLSFQRKRVHNGAIKSIKKLFLQIYNILQRNIFYLLPYETIYNNYKVFFYRQLFLPTAMINWG